MPESLNADLLYRFNYGPINADEYTYMILFIFQQYYYYEAFRRADCVSSIRRGSWKSKLPFARSPINNHIGTNINDAPVIPPLWTQGAVGEIQKCSSLGVPLIDPVMGELLLSKMFPGRPKPPMPRTHTLGHTFLMSLEIRLSILAWHNFSSVGLYAMVPFAALLSDAIRNIDLLRSESPNIRSEITRPFFESQHFKTPNFTEHMNLIISKSSTPAFQRLNNIKEALTSSAFRQCYDTKDVILLRQLSPGINLVDPTQVRLDPAKTPSESFGVTICNALQLSETSLSTQNFDPESAKVDISKLDASYICSGPYRLMLTTAPERHLFLDSNGFLHVFWDFERYYLGESLGQYAGHFYWDPQSKAVE